MIDLHFKLSFTILLMGLFVPKGHVWVEGDNIFTHPYSLLRMGPSTCPSTMNATTCTCK
ncbi:hypothetical protein Hdeb2414_s0001g00031951 [Helianthus debilis subsp. tardiflorus]